MSTKKHTLTYNGMTKTVAQWARIVGIDYSVLKSRKEAGWDDTRILETPVRQKMGNRPKTPEGMDMATGAEAMAGLSPEQRETLAEFSRMADNGRWYYEPGAA